MSSIDNYRLCSRITVDLCEHVAGPQSQYYAPHKASLGSCHHGMCWSLHSDKDNNPFEFGFNSLFPKFLSIWIDLITLAIEGYLTRDRGRGFVGCLTSPKRKVYLPPLSIRSDHPSSSSMSGAPSPSLGKEWLTCDWSLVHSHWSHHKCLIYTDAVIDRVCSGHTFVDLCFHCGHC